MSPFLKLLRNRSGAREMRLMCNRLIVSVTLLPMLLHSIFGCCWHHTHFDHADAYRTSVVHADIHPHQCTHHRCLGIAKSETSTSGIPVPCQHHTPCDEERCVFLSAKLLRIAFAFAVTAEFVAPEAGWSVTLHTSLPSLRALAASHETPTSPEHCAQIQVWIV